MATEIILPAWERFRLNRHVSFRFEPGPHLSYLHDQILWSITGALRQSGIAKPSGFERPEDLIRGSHVHAACHYLDEGDLDWAHFEATRPELIGYIRGWEAFKRDYHFIPLMMELPMYASPEQNELLFSGIPDRVGLILEGDPCIVEIKSGAMKFWTAYQTAGQDLLLRAWEEKPIFRRRFGVALQADGTYKKPVEFTDEHDYDVMRAALVVSQAAGGVDRGKPPLDTLA